MRNNKYIIKNLAPWMMEELIAFSKIAKYEIVFLRMQDEFYSEDLRVLENNGVSLLFKPQSFNNIFKKIGVLLIFVSSNINKFGLNYNGIIGLKSIWWFLKLDLSKFSQASKIHAQFATQAAIVSLLIKKYYNNKPTYSFTFHAYDIYYNNKWFTYLVNKCYKAFSISEFNIDYVSNKYIKSDKIALSRLGVNKDLIVNNNRKHGKDKAEIFKIGLISWFVEKKGIIYLLEAMKLIKDNGNSNIKLQIAGDGPLKTELLNFVSLNQLKDTVEFIGKVNGKSKDEFFRNLDTFVLPSISLKNDQDGIPVVLMEAVAYGLPIISTNVSGIPEICVDDYNGYLIAGKNSEAIFESILKLESSKNKNKDFSKNALEMSLKYDININSKRKVLNLDW